MGMVMMSKPFLRLSLLFLLAAAATAGRAQAPAPAAAGQEPGPPAAGQRPGPNEGQGRPLFGKITVISKGSLELAKPDGRTVAVKITDKTEYRKDRQSAKLEDFKVGDMVFVRGEENADHSVTAQMIGGGTGGIIGGRGFGELGKDFVVGEVKSIGRRTETHGAALGQRHPNAGAERRDLAAQGTREYHDGRHPTGRSRGGARSRSG